MLKAFGSEANALLVRDNYKLLVLHRRRELTNMLECARPSLLDGADDCRQLQLVVDGAMVANVAF